MTVQTAGIWSRYQPRSLIGQGVYGKVHKAICLETNRTVAVKETVLDMDGILPTTMRELSIITQVQHRNVVRYRSLTRLIDADQCMINNQVFIVMEFCDQDLAQFIRSRMEVLYDSFVVRDFLYQILSGVEAIHKAKLVHRDIKPANILVLQENDGSFCLKIADFGLGRRFEHVVQNYTPGTQTMLYRAPEVFLNVSKVFHVIDIWSVGCIFAVLSRTIGRPPPEDYELFPSPLLPTEDFGFEKPELTDSIPRLDADGQDLMAKMLVFNPNKRITASRSKQHVYFNGQEKIRNRTKQTVYPSECEEMYAREF